MVVLHLVRFLQHTGPIVALIFAEGIQELPLPKCPVQIFDQFALSEPTEHQCDLLHLECWELVNERIASVEHLLLVVERVACS